MLATTDAHDAGETREPRVPVTCSSASSSPACHHGSARRRRAERLRAAARATASATRRRLRPGSARAPCARESSRSPSFGGFGSAKGFSPVRVMPARRAVIENHDQCGTHLEGISHASVELEDHELSFWWPCSSRLRSCSATCTWHVAELHLVATSSLDERPGATTRETSRGRRARLAGRRRRVPRGDVSRSSRDPGSADDDRRRRRVPRRLDARRALPGAGRGRRRERRLARLRLRGRRARPLRLGARDVHLRDRADARRARCSASR